MQSKGAVLVVFGILLTTGQAADVNPKHLKVNDPRYVGCFADRRSDDASRVLINQKHRVYSATPITECIHHCRNFRYKYAALQWSNECRCGNEGYDQLGPCNGTNCTCDRICSGNPSRYCGGAWSNSVFITEFHDVRYLGCYRAPGDPKVALSTEVTSSLSQFSVNDCVVQCAKRQLMYAGLLAGSRCFCGNTTSNYKSAGTCAWIGCSCDSSCPNGPQGSCGGPVSFGIYLAVSDPSFRGCYASSAINFGYSKHIDNYTASDCKYQCKKSYYQYEYAALEHIGQGWKCVCANNIGSHRRCELDASCACYSRCPQNATQICGGNQDSIIVYKSGCPDGQYGKLCDKKCHCKTGGCDVETGRCPPQTGCASGWTGPNCDQACPGGSHGENCQHFCSRRCLDRNCDRITGHCQRCAPGMAELPLCDKECFPGSFGDQCRFKCRCANSEDCDVRTGGCKDDLCAAGYTGHDNDPACQTMCSGTFGLKCNSTCHCKQVSTCDHVTGECKTGRCEAGFEGSKCQQVCNETKFGENCELDCHCNGPCNRRIGCQECAPGWFDLPGCQTSAYARNQKIAAGCLIPLFLLLILLFLFYWFFIRKREGEKPLKIDMSMMSFKNLKDTLRLRRSGLDNPSLLDVELYENVKNSTRIKLCDLESYIFSRKEKENLFKNEYEALPKDFIMAASPLGLRSDVKKLKNRFSNVIPYEHNRVPLCREKGDETTEYINASFMTDYQGNTSFIASQGPHENTVHDFFRMIWEHSVPIVVMVTKFVEDGKVKCNPYWDEEAGKPRGFKDFIVTVIKEDVFPEYTLRNLLITKGMEERNVLHFSFTGWPDHGVPDNANAILSFHHKVKKMMEDNPGPVVVHCSAGIGRTGTFLALDFILDQAQSEGIVDVFSAVELLRRDRVNMVQNLDQYLFIYHALLEWNVVGFTSIPHREFAATHAVWSQPRSKKLNSKIEEQFRLLEKMRQFTLKTVEMRGDPQKSTRSKDRLDDIKPVEDYRVKLVTEASKYGEYINAVFVDGYKRPSAFIATQIPMVETQIDLWRMVKDYNISCIVCFTDDKDFLDKGMPYWPEEDSDFADELFTVSCTASNQMGNLLTCVSSDLTLVCKSSNISYERHLRLLNVMWYSEKDSYGPTSDLLELLLTIKRWQQTQPANTKVAVQSMYGCDKCGVFMAISNLIDKLNSDQEVDVFQVVKRIRKSRPQFIRNLEQYKYLYDAVELFLNTFHLYSNFS